MNFMLIPFFLVARLAVDESAWKHGPEYVFEVENNVTTIPVNHDGVQLSNHTIATLFCRPKEADKLKCHLGSPRVQSMDVTNDNRLEVPEDLIKELISEEPFEIKFNDRGIEYLIVDEDIHTYQLNTVKVVAELLHIGADLNGKPDGNFESTENSTIGHCNVTFGINHFPSKELLRKIRNLRYELESLPQLNKVPGEAIVIQKTRNLNNCSCYADFYYGTYGENTVVERELDSHLESSAARILVSDIQFVSSVTRIGSLGARHKKHHVVMTEHTSLTLKDIRAAKRELPEIPRPSKTTIVANSEVEAIFAMK